jgi:hypothetical protein
MGAPGGDAFLGLLSAGINFDQKRFARDIGLFKPKVGCMQCVRASRHGHVRVRLRPVLTCHGIANPMTTRRLAAQRRPRRLPPRRRRQLAAQAARLQRAARSGA